MKDRPLVMIKQINENEENYLEGEKRIKYFIYFSYLLENVRAKLKCNYIIVLNTH